MAKIVKEVAFVNVGSLIQLVGVGCFAIGIFFGGLGMMLGLVLMVILLIVGSSKSKQYRCSNCGNHLADSKVKRCPSCRETLA